MSDLELETPVEASEKPYAFTGTADAAAARLGLSRRPFYRWLAHGREHSDSLPVDDPSLVPEWYARMKVRGVFKHACPAAVIAACTGQAIERSEPLKKGKAAADSDASLPSVPNEFIHRTPGASGLAAEIDALERRVAVLRESSDEAYAKGLNQRGDQLRDQYNTELEKLRKLKKDAPKLMSDDAEYTRRSWVEEDLALVIPPMIATWMQEGGRAHRELHSTLSRIEFLQIWRQIITKVCKGLAKSSFAPPLVLDEAA